MHSWLRLLGWLVLLVALLAALAAGGGALWLKHAMRASLPQLDGSTRLPGLSANVTVRRDGHAVPHIEAANDDDLFEAQGYVTAQDRLWQMDITRRFVAGEAAEVLGSSLVEHDRLQRLLEMRPTAERIAAGVSPRDRRYLEAYARGVNAFIDSHQANLPAEFQLLMYKPKPWQPVDSALVLLGMVQMQDEKWWDKLSHERVLAKVGPTLAADLYPLGSWRDHPPTSPAPDLTAPQEAIPDVPLDESQSSLRVQGEDLLHLRELLSNQTCEGCLAGSNEWVISGAHAASGKPLLANDMHIAHSVPNIWYEVDLKAGNFHAAGVSTPGAPFVTAGHNDHIAWGFTSLYGDTQDIYIEQLNAEGEYLGTDGWKPLEHVRERIRVRGGRDVVVDVARTEHGPVITPAIPHERRILTLKWAAYDPKASGIPLYDLNAAANWTDFRAAMTGWWGPTLNVVYADDQGHIGYQAVGYIPLRQGGLSGVPAPRGQHEWEGFIPFDQLPSTLDPANGLIATANSRITPDGYPYPLTLEWAAPYRNERIWKWLAGKNHLTREDMLTLQTDIYSSLNQELGQRFAYAIDHASKPGKRLREAADLLRSWDGVMSADSAPAAIVFAARGAFWPLVLKPKLGDEWQVYQWPESQFVMEELVMHSPPQWLAPGYANWDEMLTAMVKNGLDAEHAPADLSKWRFGSIHTIDLEHPVFGLLPWFKRWTGTGRLPQSGDTSTVKQVGETFGPSQRLTVDWSDVDGSTENIVLGQSGDPLSAYYRDQWPYWYGGTTFALPFSEQAVAAAARHTLRLTP